MAESRVSNLRKINSSQESDKIFLETVSELELINIPAWAVPKSRVAPVSAVPKSMCNRSPLSFASAFGEGFTYQTFQSGDTLPCGFKLGVYRPWIPCSQECDGEYHDIVLRIAETDLLRWQKAGRAILSALEAHEAVPAKQQANTYCQYNIVRGHNNLDGCARIEDLEPSRVQSGAPSSKVVPRVATAAVEGMKNSPQQLLEEEQMIQPDDRSLFARPGSIRCSREQFDVNDFLKQHFTSLDRARHSKAYLCRRASNFDETLFSRTKDTFFCKSLPDYLSLFRLVLFAALVTAYAGVHMSAWNYKFPSLLECWLWRSSCIAVLAAGWVWVIFEVALVVEDRFRFLPLFGRLCHFLRFGALTLLVVTLTAGVFGRVFIVVESFVSLRSVPIGVYATVPWANYIPHI